MSSMALVVSFLLACAKVEWQALKPVAYLEKPFSK